MRPETGGALRDAELTLLAQARAGDEEAFGFLIAPYLRELHVHCYRMLGSVHDAEDVLQEVLMRAWRYLDAFDGRGSVRGWLYRIATNRCLTARSRAAAAPPPAAFSPPPPPANAPDVEVAALTPYPDEWLAELAGPDDPAVRYEARESVRLAFLTVIQLLPPRQRAVLLLRDVLGFSAAEAAQILRSSQASVTSALQRARATLEAHQASGRLRPASAPGPGAERALADRFTAAWHAGDIPALVSVLAEDCLLTMPPVPLAYRGREAIGAFFAAVPAGGDLAAFRLLPVQANQQPAVAAYLRDGAIARAYGIMVLTVHDDLIGEITGFADPSLFPLFGLPQQTAWPPRPTGLTSTPSSEACMAYDEDLAERVREVLPSTDPVTERRMFGGLAFMLGGHMFCGVVKDALMVRLGPDAADRALDQPHVRPMDFTGRPMKGMVFIDPAGLLGPGLRSWVDAAAEYARGLPPKPRPVTD